MKKTIYFFILLLPINLFLFSEEIPANKSIDQVKSKIFSNQLDFVRKKSTVINKTERQPKINSMWVFEGIKNK